MPHIILEYSANLENRLDMAALCLALKDAAAATGVFPPAGIRVRAHKVDDVVIADGDPDHAFIDIAIRIASGRDAAAKTRATDEVFDAARQFTSEVMKSSPFMLSLELREIDPHFSRKASSIRDYLPPHMH